LSQKQEQIDLFGDGGIRADRIPRHPMRAPFAGNPRRIATPRTSRRAARIRDEGLPVPGDNLRYDLVRDWRKAAAKQMDLISRRDDRSEPISACSAVKKMSMRIIRSDAVSDDR
jgi:hypothetical protein